VAFARALINTPRVALADEPTGSLASGSTASLLGSATATSGVYRIRAGTLVAFSEPRRTMLRRRWLGQRLWNRCGFIANFD
jgi:hypothetical protein